MSSNYLENRQRILKNEKLRENLLYDNMKIAREHIPEFHFMSHSISPLWYCDNSPIGICVFETDIYGVHNCYYCGQPTERK